VTRDFPRDQTRQSGEPDRIDSAATPVGGDAIIGAIRFGDPPPVPTERYVEGTCIRYFDGDSVEWSVVEVEAKGVPGARGPRCLLFARPDCIRRVWEYPATWRLLDAASLAKLSWHR